MAIVQISKPKSITFTVKGGSETTLTVLQEAEYQKITEKDRQKLGTANVPSTYLVAYDGTISFTTPNAADIMGLEDGDKVTGVVLVAEGATDGMGDAVGDDVQFTMSHGMIDAIDPVTLTNENGTFRMHKVTFRLDREQTATSDPTMTGPVAVS